MGDSNKDKLLQAGIELLSEKTFSEITMDLVAEASNMSKPMIYYYFKNKEGYYRSLAKYLLRMARKMMKDMFSPDISLRESLTRYVKFRIDFAETNPGLAKAYMSMIHDPNIGLMIEDLKSEFDLMRTELFDPVFDRAVETGAINPDTDRMLVMTMINSSLIAFTLKILNRFPSIEFPDPKGMIDIIFDGISRNREDR
ncbi:MAG: TetR/AcrR family transcriptional regulator [Candidatus Aegiribacteria sp.]|nr:TetR/AcrR family transcriptional regulator [Candidatus Aegiribacteria sp.]